MNSARSSTASNSAYVEQVLHVKCVHGRLALVEGKRLSACGSCKENTTCGAGLISSYQAKSVRIWLNNNIDAKPGDRVVIGLKTGTMLQAALFAYLVPAALVVATVATSAALGASDMQSALWALIALFIGLTVTQLFSHHMEGRFGSFEMLRFAEKHPASNTLSQQTS